MKNKIFISRADCGMKITKPKVRMRPPLTWHDYWWDILGLFSYLDYMWDEEELLEWIKTNYPNNDKK